MEVVPVQEDQLRPVVASIDFEPGIGLEPEHFHSFDSQCEVRPAARELDHVARTPELDHHPLDRGFPGIEVRVRLEFPYGLRNAPHEPIGAVADRVRPEVPLVEVGGVEIFEQVLRKEGYKLADGWLPQRVHAQGLCEGHGEPVVVEH